MHRRSFPLRRRSCRGEALEARLVLAAVPAAELASAWYPTESSIDYARHAEARDSASHWIVSIESSSLAQATTPDAAASLLNGGTSIFSAIHGLGKPGLMLVESPFEPEFVEARLQRSVFVAQATPEHAVAGQVDPNDTLYVDGELHGLENTGQQGGTVDADIDASAAWDITTGSRNSVVAVIDTGVDYTHRDLAANIWINQGEIPPLIRQSLFDLHGDGVITFADLNHPSNDLLVADVNANGTIDAGDLLALDGEGGRPGPTTPVWVNGINEDGDGDPYVDDLFGWDFRNNDNDPFDDHGHGTHVTGTLGAVGNNGYGTVGVSWEAAILPIKYLSETNRGQSADALMAVEYVTALASRADDRMNIRLINASWGSSQENFALRQAIDNAGSKADVLMIAAAGNGNLFGSVDNDDQPFFPASFDLDNIISVAASSQIDSLARFSNFGRETVDLAAPGVTIVSTHPGDQFGTRSGTSMAAPHVTGTAALVLANAPSATAAEVKAALLESVDPLAAFTEITVAGGRLNARRALELDRFAPKPTLQQADDLVAPSVDPHSIVIRFNDETVVDHATLTSQNVLVRSVSSSQAFAVTLASIDQPTSGPTLTATYELAPPGGSWDALDNDTFEVVLQGGQVADTKGNIAGEALLGDFTVDIPPFEGLFIVDSTADTIDANPGDDLCADSLGECTLRAAVMEANADSGNNTIVLPADLFTLTLTGRDENGALSGDLDVTDTSGSLKIIGAGSAATTIDAAGIDRVFDVSLSAELSLENLTLRGGDTGNAGSSIDRSGGSVRNQGTLELTGVVAHDNQADADGGGIFNDGGLTVVDSTLHDNTAGNSGGGIFSLGTAVIEETSLYSNQANVGGALSVAGANTTTVTNATVSLNTAITEAGGISIDGSATLTINHATVTANQAPIAGGVSVNSGTVTIGNSIIAGNSANVPADGDIIGTVATDGYNLISVADSATGFDEQQFDQLGTAAEPLDARLEPFAVIEGFGVHRLSVASPAIDAADPLTTATTDQRGVPRTIDGDHNGSALPDIGAVERYFAEIRGNKYLDRDGDGLHDPEEEGLPGWVIYLDANRNGRLDADERSATTDANGDYTFDNLDPTLSYTVAEVQQPGWTQSAPASGRTFSVDSTVDALDALVGDGLVTDANGNATLRAAIQEANALPGHDTIILAAGVYDLLLAGDGEDSAFAGDLDVLDNLTIVGAGPNGSVIDGNDLMRLFDVPSGVTLIVRDLTLTGGVSELSGQGGAIEVAGTLRLSNVIAEGNVANSGGAIHLEAGGIVEIERSTLRANNASTGGALFLESGSSARVIRSTLHDNDGSGAGGILAAGDLQIENSTLSGNQATAGSGGAVFVETTGVVEVTSSTIAWNNASAGAGGIHVRSGGVATVGNTIIAKNQGSGRHDVGFEFVSSGFNLIGNALGSTGFGVPGDQVGTDATPIDPLLEPLADYGGSTWTHRIVTGSPAIDTGDSVAAPPVDQRGIARPLDGDSNGSLIVDIGAFEHGDQNLAPVLTPSAVGTRLSRGTKAVDNTGIAIADLLPSVTDPNAADPRGIAITAANFTGGLVQYSLNGGGNWFNVGQVQNDQALLLTASPTTRIRYQPDPMYIGTVFDAITFRAWDQTQGTEGQRIDTTLSGGFTAFSSATDRWEVTVSEAVGVEVLVNETTLNTQRFGDLSGHSLALLTNGNYVAVWQTPGDGTEIAARVFAPDGTPISGDIAVNNNTLDDQIQPTVSATRGGGFIVSWYSEPIGGSVARQFDSSGMPLAPEFLINNSYLNDRRDPVVAANSEGYFVVAFSARSLGPQAWETVVQVMAPDGEQLSLFRPYTRYGHDYVESVTWLTDDLFAVSYYVDESAGDNHVHFGIFDIDGNVGAAHVAASDTLNGNQSESNLAAGASGVVLTWTEQTPSGNMVFARRFDAAGVPLGDPFVVNNNVAGDHIAPSIDMAANGDFTIAFTSVTLDPDNLATTFARRYRADGTPLGDTFRVNTTRQGVQQRPSVVVEPDGDFLIAFDGDGIGDDRGIFVQRYETNDAPKLPGWPVGDLLRQDIPEQDNVGVTVSEFLYGVTDTDENALSGIAITGINETSGQVQYSVDGGNAWSDLDAISATNALLLADDPQNRIRFLPDTNFLGTIDDAVSFHAWDQTDGDSGTFVELTDVGGETAFSAATSTFQFAFTDLFWDGGGDDESWNDPLNWSGDQLPSSVDRVVIDSTTASTIIVEGNPQIRSLGSSVSIQVATGTFSITDRSHVDGNFQLSGGTQLSAIGTDAIWTVSGSATIDAASLLAADGARIVLPQVATYTGVLNDSDRHLRSTGAGSLIDLSGLTTFTGHGNLGVVHIEAATGGTVDLSAAQRLADKTSLTVSGTGDMILLDSLTEIDGRDVGLSLNASNGGTLSFPVIESVTGVNIQALSGGVVDLFTATSFPAVFNGGLRTFEVDGPGSEINLARLPALNAPHGTGSLDVNVSGGGKLDLASATQLSNKLTLEVNGSASQLALNSLTDLAGQNSGVSIIASNSAQVELPQLASATAASLIAEIGGQLEALSLTTVNGQAEGNHFLWADGANSELRLPGVQSIVGNPDSNAFAINATNGGSVDLSGTTAITGANTQVTVAGSGSSLNMSSLASWDGNATLSTASVFNGGHWQLGSGTIAIDGVGRLSLDTGGQVTAGTLELANNVELFGNGTIDGNLTSAALIAIGDSASPTDTTALLQITGDYQQLAGGRLEVDVAGATPSSEYDQLQVGGNATFDGELTVSLANGFTPQSGDQFQIAIYDSTTHDPFSSITGLDSAAPLEGYFVAGDGAFHVGFTGVFWDGGAGNFQWNAAANWSNDTLPAPGDDVVIIEQGHPTIILGSGTASVRSLVSNEHLEVSGLATLTVTGASAIRRRLTVAPDASLRAIGPDAYLQVTDTTTIDRANLEASGGGVLELPHATSYVARAGVPVISAEGTGSQIILSGLTSIDGGIGAECSQCPDTRVITFQAVDEGVIDLPVLTAFNDQFILEADGSGSVLNAPLLTTIDGSTAGGGGTRLRSIDGGVLAMPQLATLRRVEAFAIDGGVLDLSGVTTLDNQSGYLQYTATGNGSEIDLSGLGLFQSGVGKGCGGCTGYYTDINALNGGRIDFSSLHTLNGIARVYSTGSGSEVDLPAMTTMEAGRGAGSVFGTLDATDGGRIDLTTGTLAIGAEFDFVADTGVVTVGTLLAEETVIWSTMQGTLTGNLINQGAIAVGSMPVKSNLVVTGDFVQTSSGSLAVQLGQSIGDQSENDLLSAQGSATLDGTLEISLLTDHTEPGIGNSYRIVDFSESNGEFASVSPIGLSPGHQLLPRYQQDHLELLDRFYVFDTTDAVDQTPGDDLIDDGTGRATLRAAIQEANARPGHDTVYLGPGTFTLTIPDAMEDLAQKGDLDITDDLTLVGAGHDLTTIDAAQLDRVLHVIGANVTIEGITITGGDAGNETGGGIRNGGTLLVLDSVVVDNTAELGGGIVTELGRETTLSSSLVYNNSAKNGGGLVVLATGQLTAVDSAIVSNLADDDGGGIYSTSGGIVEVERSLIFANIAGAIGAEGEGGGIYNTGLGSIATLADSTVSGNTAFVGGGIGNDGGTISLDRVTITSNLGRVMGGGIDNKSLGSFSVGGSVIADNTSPSQPDIGRDPFTSFGHNLIGITDGTLGFVDGVNNDRAGNQTTPLNAMLDALADNGGPTLTHLPLAGSPLIDAGPAFASSETDQRGAWRKIDGDYDGIAMSDIGATEYAFFVDDLSDTPDANPGDGLVADADGNQTLRAAIMEANALAGYQAISLPAGTFVTTIAGQNDDASLSGDYDILDNLSIVGDTATTSIIDANQLDRVFDVHPASELVLNHVTVTGGHFDDNTGGGGIVNRGSVQILDSAVSDNYAEDGVGLKMLAGTSAIVRRSEFRNNIANSGSGGAIHVFVDSTLLVEDSTFVGNRSGSGNHGGAIAIQNDSNAEIRRSLFEGNIAAARGGAISTTGDTLIENSTFYGNRSNTQHGGAIRVRNGETRILNSTITNNTGGTNDRGGGIYQELDGRVVIGNSVVAANVADDHPDLSGVIHSLGNNFFATTDGATIHTHPLRTDLSGTVAAPLDPQLGPLQDNGGLTQSREPLEGSPLIDAADDYLALPTDQRGRPRAIDGNYDATPVADIGAVEFDARGFTVTVDTFLDTVDGNPGDGIVSDTVGTISLRAAIMEANASASQAGSMRGRTDTIILPAGTYTLSLSGSGEDLGAAGDLDVLDHLRIVGAGAGITVIDGAAIDRVLDIGSGVTVEISGLTISGGHTSSFSSRANLGGGIYNEGRLHATDLVIGNNTAASQNGGGLHAAPGSETFLQRVTINGNTARGGGGIDNEGSLSLTNVTISGNTATSRDGGGIHSTGTVDMAYSTVARNNVNSQTREGEGIYNDGGTFMVRSSIVAENGQFGETDISHSGQPFQSLGHNVIGAADPLSGFEHGTNNDAVGTSADLVEVFLTDLATSSGRLPTHSFSDTQNPAIDAGDTSDFPTTDARGVLRTSATAGLPDIGAHEYVGGFLVNTFADTPDADTADGLARDAAGNTSLRAAVIQANADQSAEATILLGAGTYTFALQDNAPEASNSNAPSISADGRFIAYESNVTSLVPGDTNNATDIFVYDRELDRVERVSVAPDGTEANDQSEAASISADGRYVTFQSRASNLVPDDTNNRDDVFVYDRFAGTIERVSIASVGTEADAHSGDPAISGDGRYVTFTSLATNLVGGTINEINVYVYDRTLDSIKLVSRKPDGKEGNDASSLPQISADGNWIVFRSFANDLVAGDNNSNSDIFRFNNSSNQVDLVSIAYDAAPANADSYNPSISADGSYILYETDATNLFPTDTQPFPEIVLYNSGLGTLERVSVNNNGDEADNSSDSATISSDGKFVVFLSKATNLDGSGLGMENKDVFLRNRDTHQTVRLTAADGNDPTNQGSRVAVISADGTNVAFDSDAANIVAQDTNASRDIFYLAGDGTFQRANVIDESNRGDLDIRTNLVIQGAGIDKTIIDAAQLSRLIELQSNVELILRDLTLTGGDSGSFDGGGVLAQNGTLRLERVEVTGNRSGGSGGGIAAWPNTLTSLVESTVSLNTSGSPLGGGGGIFAVEGDGLEVIQSTIHDNQATNGGGVFLSDEFAVDPTFDRATISGNRATEVGGGVLQFGTEAVFGDSTIMSNSAGQEGGGVLATETTVVGNTIVAENTAATAADLSGDFISNGYNLIGNGDDSNGFTHGVNNDQVGTTGAVIDAGLLPLADNGGPSPTHAIGRISPALDAGNPLATATIDQRGLSRMALVSPDIGAFELQLAEADVFDPPPVTKVGGTTTSPETLQGISVSSGTAFKGKRFNKNGIGEEGAATPGAGVWIVAPPPASVITEIDFGNRPLSGSIAGRVFNDINADGVRAPEDPPLEGWTLYLDLNANDQLDAGEPQAVSGPDGSYLFAGLESHRAYRVVQLQEPDWDHVAPLGGVVDLFLAAGETKVSIDFGNVQTVGASGGEISGVLFEDLNLNGNQDPGEAGLGGRRVYLDLNDNDTLDGSEPSTITEPDGSYEFTQLGAGVYLVRAEESNQLIQVSPITNVFTQEEINVGSDPQALASGDFLGNGRVDLIVANGGSNSITLLESNADHELAVASHLTVGGVPSDVVAGHFNADSLLDFAVSHNESNFVSVFLNQGSGNFGETRVPITYGLISLTAADIDGDGDLDLPVAGVFGGTIYFLINDGAGTFAYDPQLDLAVPPVNASSPASLLAAHFNDDNNDIVTNDLDAVDLAYVDLRQSALIIATNNGAGSFSTQSLALGARPYNAVAGDFNGDNHTDLAVTLPETGQVVVALNNGSGGFGVLLTLDGGDTPAAIASSDVDNDGDLDLVVSNRSDTGFKLLRNQGNGTFIGEEIGGSGSFASSLAAAMIAVDLDQDGDQDFAFANGPGSGEATLLYNDLAGKAQRVSLLEQPIATANLGAKLLATAGAEVVGRHLFYNDSHWDGYDPAATATDWNAIATDKSALTEGTATFANYTSFVEGITGIAIDVAGLPHSIPITPADFSFRVGNGGDPSTWAALATLPTVSRHDGQGTGGSDRIALTWPAGSIVGQWLQVTLLANANTGLQSPDVFYFGNAPGETGNSAGDSFVNGSDFSAVRSNPTNFLNPSPIDDPHDFNRDGRVNAIDLLIVRDYATTLGSALQQLSLPESLNKSGAAAAIDPKAVDELLADLADAVADSGETELGKSLTELVDALASA